jgi:uncharacterized lipoprotein YajG
MRFLFILAALSFLAGCPPHQGVTAAFVARAELRAP